VAGAFERYVEALGTGGRVELVELAGQGGVRQELIGRSGFWFPVVWEGYLVPGREFVWVARVRLLGFPLMRAGDEFKDGKGRMRVGRRILDGDGYDRAEYTVLWTWTLLLAPQEAQARADVIVEAAGADAARVSFPFRTETWECTLRFAPEDGLLRTIETHRFEPRSRHTRRWSAEVEQWRSSGETWRPAVVLTRWEGNPAVRIEIEHVSFEGV
jgi:hypothetical protein